MKKGGRSFATFGYIAAAVFALGMFIAILNYYDDSSLLLSPGEEQEAQQVSYEEFEPILISEISEGLVVVKEGELSPTGKFMMTGQRIFDPSVPSQYDEMMANIRMLQAQQSTYLAVLNLNTLSQQVYQIGAGGILSDTGEDQKVACKDVDDLDEYASGYDMDKAIAIAQCEGAVAAYKRVDCTQQKKQCPIGSCVFSSGPFNSVGCDQPVSKKSAYGNETWWLAESHVTQRCTCEYP